MVPAPLIAAVILLYIGLLFIVAHYADKRRDQGRSLICNPNIYSLSLAVYLTSWTYYGSVGRAATTGLDFLPTYLGPTLVAFTWWFTLRKVVRISKEQRIVSIADFISSRYGKSVALGALVTIFAVVGIMPYIALQLKAVAHTFNIITATPPELAAIGQSPLPFGVRHVDTALIAAVLLGIFGIFFGARHLDATERHEGLVAAIAVESVVKLVALLAVGLFVTYGMFDGFGDIFSQFSATFPDKERLFQLNQSGGTSYTSWFSHLFIAMMAVMFLPRQFHVMVIENSREEHIRQAMWRFPAYMFLITLFVFPIALGGLLLQNGDASSADYFVLQLPLMSGHPWLALVVYIGGFSAAAGMVMVESVTLSTMVLNHIIIPVMLRFEMANTRDISRLLINLKRVGILAVIALGYLYHRAIGDSFALVNIGLTSFVAAAQFAPAMIGAIYWKRANRLAAATGLFLGFIFWSYTLLIPSFVLSGWLPSELLTSGPFGIELLKPLELFGLSGFDMWTHALFWSIFVNVGAFLGISLLTEPKPAEMEQAVKFVDVFSKQEQPAHLTRIVKAPSIIEFVELMGKFIGEKQAAQAISEYLNDREIDSRGKLAEHEIPALKRFTERTLAGSVGAAPARIIVDNYLAARGSHMEDVFDIFGSVNISRATSREQLGVLYDVAKAVAKGEHLQDILNEILTLLTQQFQIDLCVVRLHDPERRVLMVQSSKGVESELLTSERQITGDTYLDNAFINNQVYVVNNTEAMDYYGLADTIRRENITAFAHIPISTEGETIGVLSVYSKTLRGLFTDEFVELFKAISGQIGVAYRNERITNELITAKEQEKELLIAKNIQLSLLPYKIPEMTGLQMTGLCVPAKQVGGDYYDYLRRDENQLDLLIADVSGHNIGAALIMAETRAFIRAKTMSVHGVGESLRALNSFFFNDLNRAEMFITLFYVRFDRKSNRLTYANAGHNKPFLWRNGAGKVEQLDSEGMILGIKPEVNFEERETPLEPGDILMLYTDGLTESENNHGEFFGEERLEQVLKEYHGCPPDEIVERIMEQARLFTGIRTFRDDVTLVIVKVLE